MLGSRWLRFFLWSPVFLVSFFHTFRDCSKGSKYNWYRYHLYVRQLFLFSGKIQVFVYFFHFILFLLRSQVEEQNLIENQRFFINWNYVWSSSWDWVICLYLRIPEKFMVLILLVLFWFVHLLFGSLVKFLSLAQFWVNHLTHPFGSTLYASFSHQFLSVVFHQRLSDRSLLRTPRLFKKSSWS